MPNRQAIEREIQSILIRHLPVGLEGVGMAQTQALIQMLERRSAGRSSVDEDQRKGLVLLTMTAQTHAATATFTPDGEGSCGVCHLPGDGMPEAWPCSVWTSAELLGLVKAEDYRTQAVG